MLHMFLALFYGRTPWLIHEVLQTLDSRSADTDLCKRRFKMLKGTSPGVPIDLRVAQRQMYTGTRWQKDQPAGVQWVCCSSSNTAAAPPEHNMTALLSRPGKQLTFWTVPDLHPETTACQ